MNTTFATKQIVYFSCDRDIRVGAITLREGESIKAVSDGSRMDRRLHRALPSRVCQRPGRRGSGAVMKRRERTSAFYVYAFAIGLLFAFPWIAFVLSWALQNMNAFEKYLALLAIALLTLVYKAKHTFNPK